MPQFDQYPRFLFPGFEPFDPLDLTRKTEAIVTRRGDEGLERKYTAFYCVPVYRGIATGYGVGCNLRCFYCWSGWERDFPEKFGAFYSPKAAAGRLFGAAEEGLRSKRWRDAIPKVEKLRISGCEPTIGKEHLLELLRIIHESKYPLFILETNGIILGSDQDYVRKIAEFKDKLYVRVSIKAALPEAFTQRTGARGEFCELPFRALRYLLNEGIDVRAAAMTDPRIMPKDEREILLHKLNEIDPAAKYYSTLEEETIDPYPTSIERMQAYFDKAYAKRLMEKLTQGG